MPKIVAWRVCVGPELEDVMSLIKMLVAQSIGTNLSKWRDGVLFVISEGRVNIYVSASSHHNSLALIKQQSWCRQGTSASQWYHFSCPYSPCRHVYSPCRHVSWDSNTLLFICIFHVYWSLIMCYKGHETYISRVVNSNKTHIDRPEQGLGSRWCHCGSGGGLLASSSLGSWAGVPL